MTLSKDLLKRIEQVVGPANFFPAETDRICYATDSSLLSQMNNWMPELVVRVLTSGQVSRVLALANEFHVPVVPRGAGTGQCCGAVARHGGIMMDLTGMNRIVSMDLDNMQVTVQPGIVHAELNKELAVHGFFFPPDPGSTKMCTLGGMVSNNSSGQRSVKYGTTKQYILGLARAEYREEELGFSLHVMRRIKRLLDPRNILNPGKMSLDDQPPVVSRVS